MGTAIGRHFREGLPWVSMLSLQDTPPTIPQNPTYAQERAQLRDITSSRVLLWVSQNLGAHLGNYTSHSHPPKLALLLRVGTAIRRHFREDLPWVSRHLVVELGSYTSSSPPPPSFPLRVLTVLCHHLGVWYRVLRHLGARSTKDMNILQSPNPFYPREKADILEINPGKVLPSLL